MADSGSGIINGQEEHQGSCQPDSQEAMVLSKDPGGQPEEAPTAQRQYNLSINKDIN